jgi:hypothetical protein
MCQLKERKEQVEKAIDSGRKLIQAWNDRLTFNNLRLRERYVNGTLNLVAHVRCDLGDNVEYLAIFKKAPNVSNNLAKRNNPTAIWAGLDSIYRTVGINHHGEAAYSACSDDEPSMLVDVVQPLDDVQDAGLTPSVVRLYRFIKCKSAIRHPLYLAAHGGFVRCPFVAHNELGLGFLRNIAVGFNELPNQVIKGASQVMDYITNDDWDVIGDGVAELPLIKFVAGLRVFLNDERVTMEVTELSGDQFQLVDVAFGPFDLEFDNS